MAEPVEKEGELIGSTINERYRISEKLGQGGMGTVYRGMHIFMERPVAIKVLHSHLVTNNNFIQRFLHEARINSKLTHRNAVVLYDFGVHEKMPYLVFEFVDGRTLREVLLKDGAFDIDRFRNIIMQIGAALGHAHTLGIIHRDLKPDNIMVRTCQGEGPEQACVLDFGIAKAIHHSDEKNKTVVTQMGMVMGTPQYLSPEQALERELDSRSDIYSLGIIMYEMLTGAVPFKSNSSPLEILVQHLNSIPAPIRTLHPELNIPAGISEPVMRCLQKDPNDRFQSVQDLLTAIELGYQAAKRIAEQEREASLYREESASETQEPQELPIQPEPPVQVPSPTVQDETRTKWHLIIGFLAVVTLAGLYFSWPKGEKSDPGIPPTTPNSASEPIVEESKQSVETRTSEEIKPEPHPVSETEPRPEKPFRALDPTKSTLILNYGQTEVADLEPIRAEQALFGLRNLFETWQKSVVDFKSDYPEAAKIVLKTIDTPLISESPSSETSNTAVQTNPIQTPPDQTSPALADPVPTSASEDSRPGHPSLTPSSSAWEDIPLEARDDSVSSASFAKRLAAARKLNQQKDYMGAAKELQALLKIHGNDVTARFQYGNALFRLGEKEAALKEFNKTLEIEPQYAPAIYSLAAYYSISGQPELALEKLKSALSLFPGAKKWAEEDKEFDALRENEEFKKILSGQ